MYVWRAVRLISRLMLDKFSGVPLVDASAEGRTVRVPNLEVFLEKLKAPTASAGPVPANPPTPAPAVDVPNPVGMAEAAADPAGADDPQAAVATEAGAAVATEADATAATEADATAMDVAATPTEG